MLFIGRPCGILQLSTLVYLTYIYRSKTSDSERSAPPFSKDKRVPWLIWCTVQKLIILCTNSGVFRFWKKKNSILSPHLILKTQYQERIWRNWQGGYGFQLPTFFSGTPWELKFRTPWRKFQRVLGGSEGPCRVIENIQFKIYINWGKRNKFITWILK